GLRTNAVTLCPCANACLTNSCPVAPDAPNISIFILIVFQNYKYIHLYLDLKWFVLITKFAQNFVHGDLQFLHCQVVASLLFTWNRMMFVNDCPFFINFL